MKTLMQITTTLILIVAIAGAAQSQEYRKMQQSKLLRFKNETKPAETIVKVTNEYNYLKIQVACKLTQGELMVEIRDPDGNKKGNISIIAEGDISSGSNTLIESDVNGEMERHYRDPLIGDWKVRFSPKNAVGSARLMSNLIFNPKADLLETGQIEEDTDANIE